MDLAPNSSADNGLYSTKLQYFIAHNESEKSR